MAGFGSPFALELGGGPSTDEAIYNGLRSAAGEGNRGQPDSLVEAWRRARARGFAAAFADERAVLQAQPATATDSLDGWEDRLRLRFAADATEQFRRDALQARFTRKIEPFYPTLLSRLQVINPAASIITPSRTLGRETQHGRAHEDHDPTSSKADGPAFNLVGGSAGAKITAAPNFSTDFIMVVQSPALGASWTQADVKIMSQVRAILDEELPAWVDFRAFADCGFVLDEDLLDVTAFCDGMLASGISPLTIATSALKVWLRSDAGVGLNGSAVSGWTDQSGNGNSPVQATPVAQPMYFTSGGADNKPYVRFDSVNDVLDLASGFVGLPAGSHVYIAIVAAVPTDAVYGAIVDLNDVTLANKPFLLYVDIDTHLFRAKQGVAPGGYAQSNPGVGADPNGFGLQEHFSDDVGKVKSYRNIVPLAVADSTLGTSSYAVERMKIGHSVDAGYGGLDLYEMVIFLGTPTAAQLAALRAYFKARYPSLPY